jgi:hypothetical protein
MNIKEISATTLFLSTMIVIFFWDMLFGHTGYYYGDYGMQYVPWAKAASLAIKQWSLPLWVADIGCGFPLHAEGQAAAAHPLRWLLFGLLPFNIAYKMSFLTLFFIAGFSSYAYGRLIGVAKLPAHLLAIIYMFGSPYAGIFYGSPALWTLAWLPLCILRAEKMCLHARVRDIGILGLYMALMWLGGFGQLALYGLVFVLFYILLRKPKLIMWGVAACVLSGIIAAVQLLPTWELLQYSGRSDVGIEFALQKSMNPLNPITLIWPAFGSFLGFDFYIGLFPVILLFFALKSKKMHGHTWIFFGLACIFILLALGRYNPIYVALLKWTQITFLRVPVKFLFFAAFPLAAMAALGLDQLIKAEQQSLRVFYKLFFTTLIVSALIYLAAFCIPRLFEGHIMDWATTYVETHIAGKPGHRFSLEQYLDRLPSFFDGLILRTSPRHSIFFMNMAVWSSMLICLVLAKLNKWSGKKLAYGLFVVLIMDLFLYSFVGTGFRGNRISEDAIQADSSIVHLKNNANQSRVYELITDHINGRPKMIANTNLLYDYASLGLYTPLAPGAYREYLKELGGVDDSTGVYMTDVDKVYKHKHILDWLNVGYIRSKSALDQSKGFIKVLALDDSEYLYENEAAYPRAFVSPYSDWVKREGGYYFKNTKPKIEGVTSWSQSEDGSIQINSKLNQRGILFISELHYRGWIATVDGVKQSIIKTEGVFKGLELNAGEHNIRLDYRPKSLLYGMLLSLFGLLIVMLTLLQKRPRT